MTGRQWLQARTRQGAWLARMVVAVLLAGVATAAIVDWALPAAPLAPREPPPRGPDSQSIEQMAIQGDWIGAWRAIPAAMARQWRRPGPIALALLTGLCWLAFSLQAIQIRSWRDGRLWASLAAVALGVWSVWPTLFFGLWQEHRWGLAPSEELAAGVRYFVLGVGLREELAKLLALLPLLGWCVARRDELAALIVGGCVGIGFAMEENVGYIGSQAASTLGRLLTAAPLHMACTALVGLAAYRACVWPREWVLPFAATLALVAGAHGLYDAFLVVPALVEYNLASTILFIVLIYQFFRELRPRYVRRGEPISLTANFLFCTSLAAAATLVYLAAVVGLGPALDVLVASLLGQAVMVYLFLREMPETLVST